MAKAFPSRVTCLETLGQKMRTRAWQMDESALRGLTNQQLAKYDLRLLDRGKDLTQIVKGGSPRRIAPTEESLL